MPNEVDPKDTTRAKAYELWMDAKNPMVTFTKTLDVTKLIRLSKKKHLKLNMLMDYCIGKAASSICEFYMLPVDNKLIQYDALAVNTIVKNRKGEINSCDLLFSEDSATFHQEYLTYTTQVFQNCTDRDLSADCMVIGTSAIIETELDSVVNIYTGFFNNPFIIWGKYRKKLFQYILPVSFQFHHTQMDGAQAGMFLENLQNIINHCDKYFQEAE